MMVPLTMNYVNDFHESDVAVWLPLGHISLIAATAKAYDRIAA